MDNNRQQREHDKFIAVGTDTAIRTVLTDTGGDSADIIPTNGYNGLVAIAPGHVSTNNSSETELIADDSFDGDWEEITNFGVIVISVTADVASATDGLKVEFSTDGTVSGIISDDNFTISAGAKKTFSFQAAAKYYRVVYTNGSTIQTHFHLQTILKPYYVKPSSHRIQDPIVDDDDAELVTNVNKAQKPDGTYINIEATDSGNLRVTDAESGLAIAKGDVIETTFIHKFGRAPDFDTGDGNVTIWDGAEDVGLNEMQYNYSTTAIIDSLSSSNNGDTQDVEVQGLDTNYALVVQTITLTGQTRVALTTNLIRIFRIKNIGSVDVAGNVYCYENTTIAAGVPTDTTKVRAVLVDGNNQTEMAVYTVPAGKTAYVRSWFASSSGAKKTTNYLIKLRARPFGQVFQLKHSSSVADAAPYQHLYVEPEVFTEKTDIEMTALLTEGGVTEAAVSAGFDIVLVDN